MKYLLFFVTVMSFSFYSFAGEYRHYPASWSPSSEADWDIVPIVEDLHQNIPSKITKKLNRLDKQDLAKGASFVYEQNVLEFPNLRKMMSVELSQMLIDVPYDELQLIMPTADWGTHLSGQLGGEVTVFEEDSLGRPTRQLDRMVLSPLKCITFNTPFNMDMTKVEVIKYEEDKSIVYWRVMFSDNNSTESDVGSVEFKRFDETSTLVTFHSGHRLNYPIGVPMQHFLVRTVLKRFFLGHIKQYKQFVREN